MVSFATTARIHDIAEQTWMSAYVENGAKAYTHAQHRNYQSV